MLRIRDLRAALPAGQFSRAELKFSGVDGETTLIADIEVDLRDIKNSWIEFSHRRPGQAPETTYRLRIGTFSTIGGPNWGIACPFTGRLQRSMYLPPDGHQFGSRPGHDLRLELDSEDVHSRPMGRLRRLRAAYAEALPSLLPAGGGRGKHGAARATMRKWADRIDAAEQAALIAAAKRLKA